MAHSSRLPGGIGIAIDRLVEQVGGLDAVLLHEVQLEVGLGLALTPSHIVCVGCGPFGVVLLSWSIPVHSLRKVQPKPWKQGVSLKITYVDGDDQVQQQSVWANRESWQRVEDLFRAGQAISPFEIADYEVALQEHEKQIATDAAEARERQHQIDEVFMFYGEDGRVALPRLTLYPRKESLLPDASGRAVDSQLLPGEMIVAEACANYSQTLVLTDRNRFLVLEPRGFGSSIGDNPRVEAISLPQVKEFRTSAGLDGLTLYLRTNYGMARTTRVLPYRSAEKREFSDAFVKLLQAAIAAAAHPSQATEAAPTPLDELEKLAGLHQSGVVSDEEWEQGKKQILRRL